MEVSAQKGERGSQETAERPESSKEESPMSNLEDHSWGGEKKRGPGRPRGPDYAKNKAKTARKATKRQEKLAATGFRHMATIDGRQYSALSELGLISKLKTRRDILRQRKRATKLKLDTIRTEMQELDRIAHLQAVQVGSLMTLCRKCYSVKQMTLDGEHPHLGETGLHSCMQ
jgi:hypothetical protein